MKTKKHRSQQFVVEPHQHAHTNTKEITNMTMLKEFMGDHEYQEPEKPVEARTVAVQSFDTRDDFIAKMRPVAQEVGSQIGVNADIILAHPLDVEYFGEVLKSQQMPAGTTFK